jgi:hypothetical protein
VDESPTVHYVRTQRRYKKALSTYQQFQLDRLFSLAMVVEMTVVRWGTLVRNLFAATIKPLEYKRRNEKKQRRSHTASFGACPQSV